MGRNPRLDTAGAWHHVMNRGIARRTLFEGREDIRYFLAQVARAVRRGELEVHAWCVLTTHFHLLVRSPAGQLSDAMRRIQNAYVRYFNRARRRDGPLVRGRFVSRPVLSLAYRLLLVGYIDANAVEAGLASTPWSYPWCSARNYVRDRGPRWLSRDWIERSAMSRLRSERYEAHRYPAAFPCSAGRGLQRLVDMRAASAGGSAQIDPLDDLLAAAPEQVLAWMRRKAELADSTSPGTAVVDPSTVDECIQAARAREPDWTTRLRRRQRSGWDVLQVGLLRDLTASALPQIAVRTGSHPVATRRLYDEHRELLETDAGYATRAAAGADHCLGDLRRWLTESPLDG